MKYKWLICILALISVVFAAADKYELTPQCGDTADSEGFIKIGATAGYYDGDYLYCYGTDVNATIGGYAYGLEKQYDCNFFRLVQLPAGAYDVNFTASYPDNTTKEASCRINISAASGLQIITYGLSNGSSFAKNSVLPLKTQISIGESDVDGTITVALKRNDGSTIKQTTLVPGRFTYDGEITLNVDANSYILHFSADYGAFHAEKDFRIIVSESENVSNQLVGQNAVIVSSPEEKTYASNYSVPIIVEFRDKNNFIITGASVSARVLKNGEEIQNINLAEVKWYYQAAQLFPDAGEYSAIITATKGNISASKTAKFFVGTPYSIAEAANFTVRIITPNSGVYSKDSVIEVRAKVMKGQEPIRDANVILSFMGKDLKMDYDSFGEYVTNIGPLNESEYSIEVTATFGNYVAKDQTTFLISGHKLSISGIYPADNQTIEFAKGTPLRINATILDELGDKVYGAQAIAKITEPDGTLLEMQLFQDQATGSYSAYLYLNKLDGKYLLKIDATHPQFVSAHSNTSFTLQFIKEKVTIFGYEIGYETLLMVIFGVAVVILLSALFRAL